MRKREHKRDFKKPLGAAHGILFSDNHEKVIIVKDLESSGSTRYSLPGGRKKSGEGWMSTLKEEVEEETGFLISGSIRNIIWLEKTTRYFPNNGEQRFYIIPEYAGKMREKNYKNETGPPFFAPIIDVIKNENYLHIVHRVALMRAVEHLALFEKNVNIAFELHNVFDKLEQTVKFLKEKRGVRIG